VWLAIFAFSCDCALAAVASLEGTSAEIWTALGAIVLESMNLFEVMNMWRRSRYKGRGPRRGAVAVFNSVYESKMQINTLN
jgi:hypothetical protein